MLILFFFLESVVIRSEENFRYLFIFQESRNSILLQLVTNSIFFLFSFSLRQDSKLRQIVTLGSQDTLEEKTVTVCFGADFVNVSFINFCATRKEIAQVSKRIWNTHKKVEIKTKWQINERLLHRIFATQEPDRFEMHTNYNFVSNIFRRIIKVL